jgi:hypothetical protein
VRISQKLCIGDRSPAASAGVLAVEFGRSASTRTGAWPVLKPVSPSLPRALIELRIPGARAELGNLIAYFGEKPASIEFVSKPGDLGNVIRNRQRLATEPRENGEKPRSREVRTEQPLFSGLQLDSQERVKHLGL